MEEPEKKVANQEGRPEEQGERKLPENLETAIPEEVLDALPPEERNRFLSFFRHSMFAGIVRRGSPVSEKITSEHITQLIENADKQDLRERAERRGQRTYNLILLCIALAFLGFLVVYLKDEKDLLYKVIIAIISFVGGFGFGRTSGKKEET